MDRKTRLGVFEPLMTNTVTNNTLVPGKEDQLADKKQEYTFRCMKCLGGRISVLRGETTAWCPHCGQGWRITWVTPEVAKIRGRIPERGKS